MACYYIYLSPKALCFYSSSIEQATAAGIPTDGNCGDVKYLNNVLKTVKIRAPLAEP